MGAGPIAIPAIAALEDGGHGPAAAPVATPLPALKRPLFKPATGRAATPDPKRKKPQFNREDGTVNVTAVPPLKWDVTDPAGAADPRGARPASRSPSAGRGKGDQKGKGKGKGEKNAGKGKKKGKGKKGRGKGRGGK